MLWLSRPPYLRWVGAGVLAVLAIYGRLAPTPTELRPFAIRAIAPGEEVTGDAVDWRPVPAGLLPEVDLPAVSAEAIRPDEPILPSDLGEVVSAPSDWWAVEVGIPPGTTPGTTVRLVASDPAGATAVVPGTVMAITGTPDGFDDRVKALVAVPPDGVAVVSVAAAEQRLTVAVAAADLAG